MTFPRSDPNVMPVARSRISLAILLAITSFQITIAVTSRAAVVESISFPVNDHDIKLDFVVCPRGTMFDGRPDLEHTVRTDLKTELWILQTEVSYRLFSYVCGREKADEIVNTNIIANEDSTAILLVEKEKQTQHFKNDFPMQGLTIDEAFTFCERLQQADPDCKVKPAQVAVIGYRLPNHREWMYACRSEATADKAKTKPHFNRWVNSPDNCPFLNTDKEELPPAILESQVALVSEFLKKDTNTPWNDLEKKTWEKEPVTKDAHDDFQKTFLSILSNALYGTFIGPGSRVFGPPLCSVKGNSPEHESITDKHVKNAWGIYHMQDNVSELAESNIPGSEYYYIEGGGQAVQHDSSKEERNRWFIWGGLKKDKNEKTEVRGENGETKDTTLTTLRKHKCGFRIIRSKVLSDTWFDAIRLAGLKEGDHSTIARDIEDKQRQVKELARDEPFVDKVDSVAAIYTLASRFRNSERPIAYDTDIDNVSSLAEIDPYFGYLATVLKNGE